MMADSFRKPEFVWMNGEMIPFENAVVHVLTPMARYGTNVFEGIRAYWNEEKKELYAFRLREHFKRLLDSVKLMRMRFDYTIEDCEQIFMTLLRKNEFKEDIHARHTVYIGGYGAVGAREPVEMVVTAYAKGRGHDIENGIHCVISSWKRIDDNSMPPRIKCGANYQNGRLALLQAKEDGYDYPILLNGDGKVAEGPGACLVMVRKGVVVASPVTAGILESVTRMTILEDFSDALKYPAQERTIDRTELYIADEVFLCGSGAEIVPIVSIDRYAIGNGKPGPITKKIQNLYFNVVRGNVANYQHWLTPAYGD
jgi:branched-chain amino acid aminotransferase